MFRSIAQHEALLSRRNQRLTQKSQPIHQTQQPPRSALSRSDPGPRTCLSAPNNCSLTPMAPLSQGQSPHRCRDLAPRHFWLTNRINAPAAITRAIRIPTINEATQCRRSMGFDPAPFCAAPMPNQKRRLPIAWLSPGGGRVCAPDGLYQQRSLGTNTSPGLDPRVASCPSCSGRPQHRREEISHEGLVSHWSAVRSRDPRDHPHLTASNTAWSRIERRSSASCHVPACPCDGASGRKT
jgi:hypothetical protein